MLVSARATGAFAAGHGRISTGFVGPHADALLVQCLMVLGVLLLSYGHFDCFSVATSTLFAFTAVAPPLTHATFSGHPWAAVTAGGHRAG
jgi:hypothetical protein